MSTSSRETERALAAKQRIEAGLEALRVGLAPYVAKHMRDRHGAQWRHYASRAHRDESSGELDVYLTATIARLSGRGGEPVIGLQTNFGGGKTHTMLALHHLAGAAQAGYPPERLDGMGPIFEAAGVETLGRVTCAVFVGTRGIPATFGCATLLTASRTRAMFQRKRPHPHFRHSARTRRSATWRRKRTKTPWETTGHLSTGHSVTPAAQLEQTSALERGSPFDL